MKHPQNIEINIQHQWFSLYIPQMKPVSKFLFMSYARILQQISIEKVILLFLIRKQKRESI